MANVSSDAVPPAILERAIADAWHRPFDHVADEYGLPDSLRAAWARAHATVRVTGPLEPFPDVWALAEVQLPRILVTTGFRQFQESKLTALGVASLFEQVIIDAIDDPVREGKGVIFARICTSRGLRPDEVVVVGDSAESELAVGRELGMLTVQVLREHVHGATDVDLEVDTLAELPVALADRLHDKAM